MSQMGIGSEGLPSVLDRIFEAVSDCFDAESAKRLLEVRFEPAVQARVDALAEKANEGVLNEAERAEYEAYINTDDFIAILKLKARRLHGAGGGAS